MNQIDNVLAERGKRYGDFTDHAVVAQALQDVMRKASRVVYGDCSVSQEIYWNKLNDVQRQALTVIADKIARILSGDPNYDDNWIDIQGYAKLAQDRLPKQGELFPNDRPQINKVFPNDLKRQIAAEDHVRTQRQRELIGRVPVRASGSPLGTFSNGYGNAQRQQAAVGGFMFPGDGE